MSRRWEFFTQYFVSMFRYFGIRWKIKRGTGEREREREMMMGEWLILLTTYVKTIHGFSETTFEKKRLKNNTLSLTYIGILN